MNTFEHDNYLVLYEKRNKKCHPLVLAQKFESNISKFYGIELVFQLNPNHIIFSNPKYNGIRFGNKINYPIYYPFYTDLFYSSKMTRMIQIKYMDGYEELQHQLNDKVVDVIQIKMHKVGKLSLIVDKLSQVYGVNKGNIAIFKRHSLKSILSLDEPMTNVCRFSSWDKHPKEIYWKIIDGINAKNTNISELIVFDNTLYNITIGFSVQATKEEMEVPTLIIDDVNPTIDHVIANIKNALQKKENNNLKTSKRILNAFDKYPRNNKYEYVMDIVRRNDKYCHQLTIGIVETKI